MHHETYERLQRDRAEKAAFIRTTRNTLTQSTTAAKNKVAKHVAETMFGSPARPCPPCLADYIGVHTAPYGLFASHGDYESWTKVWLLDGDWDDERISYELGIVEHYGGPGRGFTRMPYVQRNGSHTLVTQKGGLDI